MGKYFGTDGFRGEANKDLTVQHSFKVGRYLGYYYGKKNPEGKAKVVIGKDTRRSSYMFEYALVAGLTASGADVYLMHVTPTPSVSYIVRTDGFDCGIMISASHNPYYDNGIKIINGMGYKLEAAVEEEIERYIDGEIPEIPLATKENIGCTVDYSMGRNRYMGYLMTIPTRSFKNMRVGLDCANGAAYQVAKAVFDALGAKTYVINNDPDGTNINTNCGSTHIEGLQKFVVEKGLDVGFAYDGDADRCLCVDDKGELVDGDKILYVCGRYMKERGELNKNTIVTTIMSNLGLYKALDKKGISYDKTAVGDKYVFESMMEHVSAPTPNRQKYRYRLRRKRRLQRAGENQSLLLWKRQPVFRRQFLWVIHRRFLFSRQKTSLMLNLMMRKMFFPVRSMEMSIRRLSV